MGAGKSNRSELHRETVIIQKRLKLESEIENIFGDFPKIEDLNFTKSKFNYLHYIVFVHNHLLFGSCLESPRARKILLESRLPNGDRLIHTAINNHNEYAVEQILKISQNKEQFSKNCNGLLAYELARIRENPDIISLFEILKQESEVKNYKKQEESKLDTTKETRGSKLPSIMPNSDVSEPKSGNDNAKNDQNVKDNKKSASEGLEELKEMSLALETIQSKDPASKPQGKEPSYLESLTDNYSDGLAQKSESKLL
ncbi:unnamed protein product [Moneuplotes crassus]|uniref:Ankyrin repeat protein n=1 Tax=Euplotes crassus TaxID=5936 RepID=A0AAD2D3X2_EUPCR|nr:unnamed protein product [Moneuplotes crassus]